MSQHGTHYGKCIINVIIYSIVKYCFIDYDFMAKFQIIVDKEWTR